VAVFEIYRIGSVELKATIGGILDVNRRNNDHLGFVPNVLGLGHFEAAQNLGRGSRCRRSPRRQFILLQPPLLLFPPVRPEYNTDDARVETKENGVESPDKPSGGSSNKGNHCRHVDIWSCSCDIIHDYTREDADDWYTDIPKHSYCQSPPREISFRSRHSERDIRVTRAGVDLEGMSFQVPEPSYP
jgi:hypothetical protein